MLGRISVAIDGPAGSGKSTVARRLAADLGYAYLDTGAMYRALTWKVIREGMDPTDGDAVAKLLQHTQLAMSTRPDSLETVVEMDGADVTGYLRCPEVNNLVARVAAYPGVRRIMVAVQRDLAHGGGVVAEGRDVGTEIIPWAEVKFFLTASPGERAARRGAELEERGYSVSLEKIEEEIRERDSLDSRREVGPLKAAPEAIHVDTTVNNAQEVVNILKEACLARMAAKEGGG